MVKKLVGFIIAGIGIIGLIVSSIPKVWAKIPIPASLAKIATLGNVLIASLVLVVIGMFLIQKSGGFGKKKQELADVPIYHGENVVGFRRIGVNKKK